MEERIMSSPAHEPREEFVTQLEDRLRADLRRQRLETDGRTSKPWSWFPQSRLATGLALVTVMVVSMALGGGVVAATYEARFSAQREMLDGVLRQQLAIAEQRLALAKQQQQEVETRVSVGLAQKESVLDSQVKVAEATAEVQIIRLDLEEIKASGREPMKTLSAPLVAGRDFVTERWRVQMSVPVAALALEKMRADAEQRRVEVGVGKPEVVDELKTRIAELDTVMRTFLQKVEIRHTFLNGGLPAAVAHLRELEGDIELRQEALTSRIEFAQRRVRGIQSRVDVGTANPIELAEARMRLQELELEASKVKYELLLIRKQLGK
jgi:hypothetical protein